jgi:hypothetical protein
MERPPHQKVGLGALFKHHLRDWLGILVMIALELVVYIAITPFHRFVDKVKMQEYMYPTGPDTVPTWTIGVCISLSWSHNSFFSGLLEVDKLTLPLKFCEPPIESHVCAERSTSGFCVNGF